MVGGMMDTFSAAASTTKSKLHRQPTGNAGQRGPCQEEAQTRPEGGLFHKTADRNLTDSGKPWLAWRERSEHWPEARRVSGSTPSQGDKPQLQV